MKASEIDLIAGGQASVASLGDLLARAGAPGRANWQDLPACPGVYAVCLPGWEARSFTADAGRARFAQPANLGLLQEKRDRIVEAGSTEILYIGKTNRRLRERVRELARFAVGKARNHAGGQWLWQLEGIDDAELRMWCCFRGRPELLKGELLDRFANKQMDLPFANRNSGQSSGKTRRDRL